MKKVKCVILKPIPGYGYFEGDQAEIKAEKAEELEEQGYVEIIQIKEGK